MCPQFAFFRLSSVAVSHLLVVISDGLAMYLCSNASLNLPDGFSIIPQLYEDDEEGSDDGEKKLETPSLTAIKTTRVTEAEDASEKFRTVLEDVDGELEMEDVSPTADAEILASKERERDRLLGDHFAEEARSMPTQPPLPLEPPPSVPSPPPLPMDPPPSPPPPPRSPPPPLTTSQSPYSKPANSDAVNHQQSDSPPTPSAYSGHQAQGNLGLSQVSQLALCFHVFQSLCDPGSLLGLG